LGIPILEEAVNELALFAGAGGGILGGHLLGWRTVCAVEFDPYARDVLLARQNDGCLPTFPVWDDVRTFDGRPWRGAVDVVSGGFPCQDISAAGKGAGIGGARSGLWREMARIVGEVQPRFVWVENSPMLVGRGLGLVLLDLAAMGFSARWGVVGACDAGFPHIRERVWILAHAVPLWERRDWQHGEMGKPWSAAAQNEPEPPRVADGVARRMDRINCTGNGQVPGVAAMAWRILSMPNDEFRGGCKPSSGTSCSAEVGHEG
jgi:DNA (cytosine-5)-methyltransferase 1